MHMSMWRAGALGLAVILGGWGCESVSVRTDFDPAVEFTTFRTYTFAGLTDVNQGGVLDNSLLRKRLDQMVGQELSNKGLREVGPGDNPDLLVYYWLGMKDKQRIQSSGVAVGMHRARGPYGWGVGQGGVTTYEYTEGTLIVDLVTPAKNELVWRCTLAGTLKQSKDANLELARQGITKAFAEYPPK